MIKVIVSGFVAGIALFLWGVLSHMATPLGTMGLTMHPHEAMLLPAIQQTTTAPGLYYFPGVDPEKKMTKEEEAAWVERYQTGPHGILVVGPFGDAPMGPTRLMAELLTNVATGLLLAFLLARLATGLASYVTGGILTFLIGWTTISVPYWNWYGFPPLFTAAELIDQLVAGALMGLVIGLFLKTKQA